MKSVTVTVDDEVYRAAKAEAERRHTSLDDWVERALAEFAAKSTQDATGDREERKQRQRLVDLLEECNLDLTERPTREATYADRRFH